MVGASGVVAGVVAGVVGVTELEAAEELLFAKLFVATTVNVYDVPAVSPVTVIGELEPVTLMLPGLEVTIYDVIGDPPTLVGAVKETIAC
jgi:hypothetical protein